MNTYNFKHYFKMYGRVRVVDANSNRVCYFKDIVDFLRVACMNGVCLNIVSIAPYSHETLSVMVATDDGSDMPRLPWQALYMGALL